MSSTSGSAGAPSIVGGAARREPLTPDGFARLYEQSWRILWCVAAGVIGDRSMAQDIVQQAAVVALQRLHEFDPSTSFNAWMGRIVRNLALNDLRKSQRRRTGASDSASIDALGSAGRSPSGGSNPRAASVEGASQAVGSHGQPEPDQSSFDDEVLSALRHLEETPRACLLLRTVLDMPYREIALALGIPEGTAASHVHRARHAMRSLLSAPASHPITIGANKQRSAS